MSERDAADRHAAIRQRLNRFCKANGPSCRVVWSDNPRNWCQGCRVAALVELADADAATIAQLREALTRLAEEWRARAEAQREFAETESCVVPETLRAQADANEERAADLIAALGTVPHA